MIRTKGQLSIYMALTVFGFSAVLSAPTLTSGFYHVILILPGLFLLVLMGHYEGYMVAKAEFAPTAPMNGHFLYRIIGWLDGYYFGIRGIWFALIGMVLLYTTHWWFH